MKESGPTQTQNPNLEGKKGRVPAACCQPTSSPRDIANMAGVDFAGVWSDVQPTPQADPANAVVSIQYPPEYETAMGYLRSAAAANEFSERVLALTTECISWNPAHYTVWHIRRACLQALRGKFLEGELDFVSESADHSPKNYQVWYHRRLVVEMLGEPSKELGFVAHVLSSDAKNYHAWAHRQWCIAKYDLWSEELAYINYMLTQDLRNNSAWNHRWFVVHQLDARGIKPLTKEVIAEEVTYAMDFIRKAINNESPWNYMRGYLAAGGETYTDYPMVKRGCEEMLKTNCIFLQNTLAEVYEAENSEESLNAALELLQRLRNESDAIRCKHWEQRI
ncbi:unnamed protein product, partial [Chrysoparadoxa australica]